jgi:hypothetical protein
MGATRIHPFPAAARQHDLSATALRVLEELMLDPDTPPSVRLKAALAVLERSQPDDPHTPAARASARPHESTVPRALAAAEIEACGQEPIEPMRAVRPAPCPDQLARNALCPCGSGRKYKRCCGIKAPPVLTLRSEAA